MLFPSPRDYDPAGTTTTPAPSTSLRGAKYISLHFTHTRIIPPEGGSPSQTRNGAASERTPIFEGSRVKMELCQSVVFCCAKPEMRLRAEFGEFEKGGVILWNTSAIHKAGSRRRVIRMSDSIIFAG